MFCYTVVSGVRCVLQEIEMWSHISGDHPVFIKTVARLTNKKLNRDIISELNGISGQFSKLEEDAGRLLRGMPMARIGVAAGAAPMPALMPMQQPAWSLMQDQMPAAFVGEVRRLIDRFLRSDRIFLELLAKIRKYDVKDKVWQTLLEHIATEEEYMYRLMNTLKSQLI